MKTIPSKIGLASLVAVVAICAQGCLRSTVPDGRLGFELEDLNGDPVSFSHERFAGKVVLVELWGTWCPPCIEQIPYLNHWQSAYRERGFEIIALEFASFKPKPEGSYEDALRSYLAERGVEYTVVQAGLTTDVSSVLPELRNFRGFPTSIFVGRDGVVTHVKYGFIESERGYYEKTIEALLLESEAPAS